MTFKNIALGFGLCAWAASALPQPFSDIQAPAGSAYVQDSEGAIARTSDGMCWRTGFWTPAHAVPGCDGPLVPPIAKPTAPEIVPPPLPVQAEMAPAAPPKRCDFSITLGSEESFAFGTSTLSNAAQHRLDTEVLPRLASCTALDSILVTGHTDRFGSNLYNQKLSEKRAEAVAGYLNNRGISAIINIVGAGKTRPVSSCAFKLPRKKLIQCLAADRRVVIEVRGLAQ